MLTRVSFLLMAVAGMLSVMPDARVPVTIYVSATDSQGRAITDLTPEEIEVSVGGRAVGVEMTAAPPERTTRVVLIDGSGSVSLWPLWYPDDIGLALSMALRSAPASGGHVLLHGVGGPFPTAPLPADINAAQLTDLLRHIRGAGKEPSPLWDATVRSIDAANDGNAGSIALLLITDGRGTGNRCSVNEATSAALQHGVSVSAIDVGGATVIRENGEDTVIVDPGQILRQVTARTGGLRIPLSLLPGQQPATGAPPGSSEPPRVAQARNARETGVRLLAGAVSEWIGRTRQRYRLQLELPAADSPRPLLVTVRRPGVTVLAPSAYVTGASRPPCAMKTP